MDRTGLTLLIMRLAVGDGMVGWDEMELLVSASGLTLLIMRLKRGGGAGKT